MNFNGWSNIKKLFPYTKEKRVATFIPKREQESDKGRDVETSLQSNSPQTISGTQQLS